VTQSLVSACSVNLLQHNDPVRLHDSMDILRLSMRIEPSATPAPWLSTPNHGPSCYGYFCFSPLVHVPCAPFACREIDLPACHSSAV
jgi:hypothetical protein